MDHLPVVRDRADARIAGVCAALARSWQMDPLVVRVAFVVLALLTGGVIIAAYLALWALLPLRGHATVQGNATEPVRRLLPFTRRWSTTTLVAVVVVTAAVIGGLVTGAGPGAFVIVLLAWVILRFGFAGRRPASGPPSSLPQHPAPGSPFERLSVVWQQRLDNVAAGRPSDWEPAFDDPDPAGLYGPPPLTEPAVDAPAARRRGLRTWLLVLVALGTVWGALAITDAAGVPVPPLAWVAGSLGVFGLALVAVSRPSRAAWSRPPMLLAVTVLTALLTIPMFLPEPTRLVSVGADEAVPVGVAGLGGSHTLPVGEHVIDLSGQVVAQDSTASYQTDLGQLTLLVPREGNVVVRTHVDLGEIRLPGQVSEESMDARLTWSRITAEDAPTLTVDLSVGLGEIEVRS